MIPTNFISNSNINVIFLIFNGSSFKKIQINWPFINAFKLIQMTFCLICIQLTYLLAILITDQYLFRSSSMKPL